VPTHLIGAALLRGEWKTAVDLILDPREGDPEKSCEIYYFYPVISMPCMHFIMFSITLFKQGVDTRKEGAGTIQGKW